VPLFCPSQPLAILPLRATGISDSKGTTEDSIPRQPELDINDRLEERSFPFVMLTPKFSEKNGQ